MRKRKDGETWPRRRDAIGRTLLHLGERITHLTSVLGGNIEHAPFSYALSPLRICLSARGTHLLTPKLWERGPPS